MREDVLHPRRATELVILAERGDKMRAILETCVGNLPRIRLTIGVLDADGCGVGIEIASVPSGILVPDQLTDSSIRLHLIVRGGFSVLPDIIASLDGQISGVMMEDDLVDSPGSSGCKVFGKDEVFIGFDVFPILHDYLLIKKGPDAEGGASGPLDLLSSRIRRSDILRF